MKKRKKRLLISCTMILMLLLNVFPLNRAYADESDKTDVLTDFKALVIQNGTEVPVGGTLTSTEPISVEISFGVPVEGDEPAPGNPVKKGDTAAFQLSSAFKLNSVNNIELKMGSITVGHVNFTTDPVTNKVAANVVFDGDEGVFDGEYNTVTCKFNANLEYDASGNSGTPGDHVVEILEKSYTVNVPRPEIVYGVTKSGTPNLSDKSIEWTVDITAAEGGTAIDLAGYQFYDDLKSVGAYITGSFKVDGIFATPDLEGNAVRYIFPAGSTSPQKVTFKTEISDETYYAASEQKVTNKAQLQDSEKTVKKESQIEVKFTPKWITKTGESSDSGSSGVYDPVNRTITWTITANQMGADLKNVVITDVLKQGLTLKSADWQKWDGSAWGTAASIIPNAQGEYELGDIDTMIMLTIVTNVPDETYTTGITTYLNSANISWDGLTGIGPGTGSIGVPVGYNVITKSGAADTADQKVHWTVTVDTRKQSIPDLKVYDLLVYGSSTSGFDLTKVTGIPAGVTAAELTPQYNQKYIPNSFTAGGLSVTVHPVMQDGRQVAGLLEITGFSMTELNTFTFDSLVVNPNIFAGNTTSNVVNTAALFSADKKLNSDTALVSYGNKVLSKEMLKRDTMTDPAAGVNNLTDNLNEGFNYVDKAVIFRLSINGDGIDLSDLTNAAGDKLGKATVTDTLPEGWKFTEIVSGLKYLVFEGTGNPDGTVSASDTTPDTVTGLDAAFSGRTAVFTFDSLNKPYVILVKAEPADETIAEYFDSNKSTTERNNLFLKTENWTTGVTSYQDVRINSQLLDKTVTIPKAGELRWTVDYKPYNLSQPGTKLEDTLPGGIDLRTDSSGALLPADGNITAYEMALNTDGSYSIGNVVELKAGENVIYNNETRILSFIIPDNTKAYRFSYITDITGEPGDVSNKVSLYGTSSEQETTTKSYNISKADGEASLQKNGWIRITKKDEAGTPLAGAEFTLFALDGETVIRTGITDSSGVIKFKVIPDGDYLLQETKAPSGYMLEGVTHSLSVSTAGGMVISSIDGKTGEDSNAVVIQNFPEGTAGNLTISKIAAGNMADTTRKFDFTLTLNGAGADGTYSFIGRGVPGGTIKSGDTISLAHGQSITIVGLPKDITYAVTEADYSGDGYSKASTGETGTIAADTAQTAAFTNTKNEAPDPGTGNLTISKTVSGNAADTEKKFNFTVIFDGVDGIYAYIGNGVPDGMVKSGDTISLAHGQSITITGLPEGTTYTVTEEDYASDGYSKASTGETGTITVNAVQTAAFTNTRDIYAADTSAQKEGVPGTGDDGSSRRWIIGLAGSAFILLMLIGLNFKNKKRRQKN